MFLQVNETGKTEIKNSTSDLIDLILSLARFVNVSLYDFSLKQHHYPLILILILKSTRKFHKGVLISTSVYHLMILLFTKQNQSVSRDKILSKEPITQMYIYMHSLGACHFFEKSNKIISFNDNGDDCRR